MKPSRAASFAFFIMLTVLAGCGPRGEQADDASTAGWGADVGPAPTRYRATWAIIIGIDRYPATTRLRPLLHATNDATAVRDILRDEFGFAEERMLLLTDERATRAAIGKACGEWLRSNDVRVNDAVLFFFSGHGAVGPDGQRGYLAAVDSQAGKLDETWVEVGKVTEALAAAQCRHKAIILDSCYSGALFRQQRVASAAATAKENAEAGAADEEALAFYFRQPAFVGMSAGRLTPVAEGFGDERHSVFTACLLEALRKRAGSVRSDSAFTFRQLAALVEAEVTSRRGSRQIPHWGALGDGEGDFVFQPRVERTTQVLFTRPEGTHIQWLAEAETYSEPVAIAPARYNFAQGWLYQLKLSRLPNREGVELYPTLKVVETPTADETTRSRVVPVAFTESDLDWAIGGGSVTVVLYHTDPDDVASGRAFDDPHEVKTMSSTELGPGLDPIVEAAIKGTILAIVHLGGADIQSSTMPVAFSPQLSAEEAMIRPLRIPTRVFSEAQQGEVTRFKLVKAGVGIGEQAEQLLDEGQPADAIRLLRQLATTVDATTEIDAEERAEMQLNVARGVRICIMEMGDENHRRLQRTQLLLDMSTSLEFIETPLEDVCQFMSELHDIPVDLDGVALYEVGLGGDLPITIDVQKRSLRVALEKLQNDIPDLRFHPTRSGLKVTTVERDEEEPVRVGYPVADITADGRMDGSRLVSLIQRNVAPESWRDGSQGSGLGTIDYMPERDWLVVRHSWSVHFQIDEFLTDLRRSQSLVEP